MSAASSLKFLISQTFWFSNSESHCYISILVYLRLALGAANLLKMKKVCASPRETVNVNLGYT